jgi:DNA-binding response OmpR family regulator
MDDVPITDLTEFLQIAAHQRWPIKDRPSQRPSFRLAFGNEPIPLGVVEFRILLFLASRPYHPFTRRSIADAVSSEDNPVNAEAVDQYVSSLVDQLGDFHDYVQAVPYVGYRFKA